eukprot:2699388-Prymnesium_polylepis.2
MEAGDMSFVDALFTFSMPLGLEYMGAWTDDSTFAVTVISTTTAPMARADFDLLGVTSTNFDALDTNDDEMLSVRECPRTNPHKRMPSRCSRETHFVACSCRLTSTALALRA